MIETVAAYITVLEAVAKVCRSPHVKRALTRTAGDLRNRSDLPDNELRPTVFTAISKELGAADSMLITADLDFLDPIRRWITQLSYPSPTNRDAPIAYGHVFSQVMGKIAQTLDGWRAFELWGQDSGSGSCLSFSNTWRAIRRDSVLKRLLRLRCRLWGRFHVRRCYMNGYPFFPLEIVFTHLVNVTSVSFTFSVSGYPIDVRGGIRTGPGSYRTASAPLKHEAFLCILGGSLLDFLGYARRSYAEAQAGRRGLEALL